MNGKLQMQKILEHRKMHFLVAGHAGFMPVYGGNLLLQSCGAS